MTGKTILTGIKPTGAPHIGNYIGALRPAVRLAQQNENAFLFIADYHAINAVQDAAALRRDTYDMAAALLAIGLDPDRTTFYRQSDVPEIFELTQLLTAVTPKGLMDRSHAYKAAVDRNREESRDDDAGVNMGLYTYPILMAADILMANADIIPVGRDQVQHVEFARDMAGYFNNAFKMDVFKLPAHRIEKDGAILPGIDGRKMSKSYNNHIPMFMDKTARRKLVMKIVTDSKLPAEPKNPDENVIFQIYSHVAGENEVAALRADFEKGGLGYGDAKKRLADAIDLYFSPFDDTYAAHAANPRKVAKETLSRAREAAGLRPVK
jgi:tryptophanyl-tRNA synthetase